MMLARQSFLSRMPLKMFSSACLLLFSCQCFPAFCENSLEKGKEQLKCVIDCKNVHADAEEEQKLLEVFREMMRYLELKDFQSLGQLLEDDASMFDETKKDLVVGKDAIVERLKQIAAKKAAESKVLQKFEISDVYSRVNKDTGIITYIATKEYQSGPKLEKMVAHASTVFRLDEGEWKLIHYRRAWQKN